MNKAIEKVGAIVRRISGARHVDGKTRVYHDLSIAGDDARELLDEIESKCGVSFEKFDFLCFFPSEHEALGAHVGKAIGLRVKQEPLTIQHLADVVKRGVWFEPSTNT